jgi:MYXO-CTERM domain-containing protein
MFPEAPPNCGFGCGGCSETPDGAPIGAAVGALGMVFVLGLKRRRRAR